MDYYYLKYNILLFFQLSKLKYFLYFANIDFILQNYEKYFDKYFMI